MINIEEGQSVNTGNFSEHCLKQQVKVWENIRDHTLAMNVRSRLKHDNKGSAKHNNSF